MKKQKQMQTVVITCQWRHQLFERRRVARAIMIMHSPVQGAALSSTRKVLQHTVSISQRTSKWQQLKVIDLTSALLCGELVLSPSLAVDDSKRGGG
jgi:hypothetical protein